MATYGSSLVQSCCEEGEALQTNTAGMCGSARSKWTTLGLPQPKVACTSCVHTAQAPRCSARALSQVDPVFRTLPGLSHSGTRVLCKGTDLGGLGVLCLSQVQATQATWSLVSAQSQVGHASYAPPRSRLFSFPGVS